MLVRCRQRLRIEGTDYAAGETVDLPTQTALVYEQFGKVERADMPEQNRVKLAGENRIRRGGRNRRKGD